MHWYHAPLTDVEIEQMKAAATIERLRAEIRRLRRRLDNADIAAECERGLGEEPNEQKSRQDRCGL